jgi:hypothetical protein
MAILAIAGLFGSTTARAECAGFTDVDVGGFLTGFCQNVTWIKNRAITIGCSSSTLYCPNEPVARLSMALFMNRLGNVLSPLVLDVEDSGGAIDLSNPSAPSAFQCQSPVVAPATYPRNTHVDAVFSFDADAPVTLFLMVASSNNGNPLEQIGSTAAIVDSPGGSRRNVSTSWMTGANAGQPGQFYALKVVRSAGTGNITNFTCSLQVWVQSWVQP